MRRLLRGTDAIIPAMYDAVINPVVNVNGGLASKIYYPNYVGAGTPAQHAAAGLILDLHAARAAGTGPNSNTGASKGVWTDLSSNGYNGALQNFGYSTGSGWEGIGSTENPNELTFDGTDDYMPISSFPDPVTSDFTIEVWYNPSSVFPCNLFSKWNPGGFCLVVDNSNIPKLFLTNSSTFLAAASACVTNSYNQIVYTKTPTAAYCYLNGAAQNSLTTGVPATISSAAGLTVGKGQYANYPKGKIPIVRYYNRAISYTEITQNYKAGVTW